MTTGAGAVPRAGLWASWLCRQPEGVLSMALLASLTVRRVELSFSTCRDGQDPLA